MIILPQSELDEIRRKLIASKGDPLEALGENWLETMTNVIYSCRMKANPMQDTPEGAAKPKKEKTPSVNKATISGDDINNFLG